MTTNHHWEQIWQPWASQFQVKHNAVDHLLKVLQQHGHTDLPSTARTLLKTPRHVATIQKSGMEYFHYPLHQKLLEHLDKYPVEELQDHDTIDLSFNVDGLPLFKSSGKVMWPVLCAIHLNPIVVPLRGNSHCVGNDTLGNPLSVARLKHE